MNNQKQNFKFKQNLINENLNLNINIFNESCRKTLPRNRIINTVKKIFNDANYNNVSINIIFLDNNEIKEINKKFLNHNYATDVISFCIENEPMEGEIYISSEIARTNALEYNTTWTDELMRYVIHGVLHLIGYEDFSFTEREKMRKLENKYIAQE